MLVTGASRLRGKLGRLGHLAKVTLAIATRSSRRRRLTLRRVHYLYLTCQRGCGGGSFLVKLVANNIPSCSMRRHTTQLRVTPRRGQVLFLVRVGRPSRVVKRVLGGLFPSRAGTCVIPISGRQLTMLCPFRRAGSSGSSTSRRTERLTRTVISALGTRTLTRIRISFDRVVPSLLRLSKTFHRTDLTLGIKGLFCPRRAIFPCGRLKVKHLVCRLPTSLYRDFLRRIFLSRVPSGLSSRALLAVGHFLRGGLGVTRASHRLRVRHGALVCHLRRVRGHANLSLERFRSTVAFGVTAVIVGCLRTRGKGGYATIWLVCVGCCVEGSLWLVGSTLYRRVMTEGSGPVSFVVHVLVVMIVITITVMKVPFLKFFTFTLTTVLTLLTCCFTFPLLGIRCRCSLLGRSLSVSTVCDGRGEGSGVGLSVRGTRVVTPGKSRQLSSCRPRTAYSFSSKGTGTGVFTVVVPVGRGVAYICVRPSRGVVRRVGR